jgi:hypothetical protein
LRDELGTDGQEWGIFMDKRFHCWQWRSWWSDWFNRKNASPYSIAIWLISFEVVNNFIGSFVPLSLNSCFFFFFSFFFFLYIPPWQILPPEIHLSMTKLKMESVNPH